MKPLWSIKDKSNPPNKDTNVNWLVILIINIIDKLYYYSIFVTYHICNLLSQIPLVSSYIKQTKFYDYLNQSINKSNIFSGDFHDLADKGIFKFILEDRKSV